MVWAAGTSLPRALIHILEHVVTVVQYYIYKTHPCGNQASSCTEVSPLNVWIQSGAWVFISYIPRETWTSFLPPSYILIAISEILASITGLEYAFTKAPKNMRSLVMATFLFMSAVSAAIGEAFVCMFYFFALFFRLLNQFFSALSADPLLIWNYGTVGVLSLFSGVAFWYSVRNLDKREDHLNNLPAGHLDS